MHNHKKNCYFFKKSRFFLSLMAIVFWIALVFSFDSPYPAICTLTAVGIHELGHKIAFALARSESSLPLPSLFGFKINSGKYSSYAHDIITAAMGPLSNFLIVALAFPLYFLSTEAYEIFAVINIATALSNLLPIKGYDGYKLLRSVLLLIFPDFSHINIIDKISFIFISALSFFSLYLIGKLNEGYWIFLVFFSGMLSEISKSKELSKARI